MSRIADVQAWLREAADLDLETRVKIYNTVVAAAAEMVGLPHPSLSPALVEVGKVRGNTYNPNVVAPPEMRLLRHSIRRDGITMAPVVANDPDSPESWVVVDGFHRRTLAEHDPEIAATLHGYIPVVRLHKEVADLMASTVRHNMARGSHQVDLSAKLVATLTKHHWTDARIGEEIGMDPEEVLRMKQVTGLAEIFSDRDFSEAWRWEEGTTESGESP